MRGISLRSALLNNKTPRGSRRSKRVAPKDSPMRQAAKLVATGRHVGIEWDSQPLGQVSDAELARQLGVARITARRARERRKIAEFTGTTEAV